MTEFHIGIREPLQLRRAVLESLKAAVQSLKRYDQFMVVHKQREAQVMELRKSLRELSLLSAKLANELPRTQSMHPSKVREPRAEVTSEGARRLTKISKLNRLAQRIAEIETGLKKVG
ncbi:hypothetical protein J4439_04190 [Candidatus Woesearchaeota archaeon]|nr:hypothetical protein [Candidatus Woesearchaeota archaeon]